MHYFGFFSRINNPHFGSASVIITSFLLFPLFTPLKNPSTACLTCTQMVRMAQNLTSTHCYKLLSVGCKLRAIHWHMHTLPKISQQLARGWLWMHAWLKTKHLPCPLLVSLKSCSMKSELYMTAVEADSPITLIEQSRNAAWYNTNQHIKKC